jgi:signal transduction histidine kinase
VDFGVETPHVSADADQLQQVFLNLLLNARDAMPDGGDLCVKTFFDRDAGEVVIAVSDTGHGISEEALPHVFDPFFSTKRAGTGLGLAVCYGIVTAHGGRVEVESRGGHPGTNVRVALPADSAAAAKLAPRAHVVQTSSEDFKFETSNLK